MEYELKFSSSRGNGTTQHHRITWVEIFDEAAIHQHEIVRKKAEKLGDLFDLELLPVVSAKVMCYYKDQDNKVLAQKYALDKALSNNIFDKEERKQIWDKFFHHSKEAAKMVGIELGQLH